MNLPKHLDFGLRIEEAAQLAIAIYFTFLLEQHPSVWIYLALFLTPDIGMLGYLAGPKVGAMTYNFFHHKGIALAVLATGLVLQIAWLPFVGLLLYAHSCFDRMLGYGLKLNSGFSETHLGRIGKAG